MRSSSFLSKLLYDIIPLLFTALPSHTTRPASTSFALLLEHCHSSTEPKAASQCLRTTMVLNHNIHLAPGHPQTDLSLNYPNSSESVQIHSESRATNGLPTDLRSYQWLSVLSRCNAELGTSLIIPSRKSKMMSTYSMQQVIGNVVRSYRKPRNPTSPPNPRPPCDRCLVLPDASSAATMWHSLVLVAGTSSRSMQP